MKLNHRVLFHSVAVALLAILAGYGELGGLQSMRHAEVAVQDTLMRVGRPATADPRLVFLARDAASASLDGTDLDRLFDLSSADPQSRRALELMAQEWPWSREVYALVLDRLMEAGARAVAFDFTFPKPSENDAEFRDSLDRYQNQVVVAGNITDSPDGTTYVFGSPTASLIPEASPRDTRVGYDNFWPDDDGVVREAQYRWSMAYGVWQSAEDVSLAGRTLEKAGHAAVVPATQIPLRPRFAGPPGTFRAHPIHEIFVPKYWRLNYGDGSFFKDKIVIIGASGNWQHDEHQTPLGMMSGAEIQLNAMNAALNGEYLQPLPGWYALLICAVSACVALACCLYRPSPLLHLGLAGTAGALWIAAQYTLFNRGGVILPMAGPLAILGASALFSITYDLVVIGAERLRLRRTLLERKRAEEALQSANEELERRVEERTAELSRSNTSLKSLVEEKNVLLKEVHHRVKNNLQIISSLLNMQSRQIAEPETRQLFNESRNRVRSMALIHEKLYQSADLARIDFHDYLKTLTGGLKSSFAGKSSKVSMSVNVESIMLGVDAAVPCGLLVNELVTNSFKYAFAEAGGEICISMKRTGDERLLLTVSDNGVGFPKNIDFRNTETLGMQLVNTLTDQLEGAVVMRNGCGTTFEITFPEKHPQKL